ncbi:hypothetical protein J6590_009480 [Homalodisca vitripennis]|nr:hypothetical protein J6590_009480 [Homalodisca vitripennis]
MYFRHGLNTVPSSYEIQFVMYCWCLMISNADDLALIGFLANCSIFPGAVAPQQRCQDSYLDQSPVMMYFILGLNTVPSSYEIQFIMHCCYLEITMNRYRLQVE